MESNFSLYLDYQKKICAYGFAFAVIGFDAETVAPVNGSENRGKMLGVLGAELFKIISDKKYLKLVENLKKSGKLNFWQKRMIDISHDLNNEIRKLPIDVYTKNIEICNNAYTIWHEAKEKNNFSFFKKTLNELIEFCKKKVDYVKGDKTTYDYLLDKFEPGLNIEDYDSFFNLFKQKIQPLFPKITNNKLPKFLFSEYDISKQKEFINELMDYLQVDKKTFYCAETEHPFSSSMTNTDVRFAVKYTSNNFFDCIFSAIHEIGHSFFQAYIDKKFIFTPIETNISMGLHESQSRFLENYIAKRKSFWVPLFPKLKKLFPSQLKNVDIEIFVDAINTPILSLIRTEADEFTYTSHVIIRYELEKDIFTNKIKDMDSLKKTWNNKYKQYLNIEPKNDTEGILQDVHWSGMCFGYFPTYALGSAFAAQFFNQLNKEIDIDKELSKGNFLSIKEWLTNNIYQYGALYKSKDLIKKVCHEEFNPKYYIDHLLTKIKK